jgi:hypothetical protein
MRMLIFSLLGAAGLAGGLLFCDPVRDRVEVTLVHQQATLASEQDEKRPLKKASEKAEGTLRGICDKAAEFVTSKD